MHYLCIAPSMNKITIYAVNRLCDCNKARQSKTLTLLGNETCFNTRVYLLSLSFPFLHNM